MKKEKLTTMRTKEEINNTLDHIDNISHSLFILGYRNDTNDEIAQHHYEILSAIEQALLWVVSPIDNYELLDLLGASEERKKEYLAERTSVEQLIDFALGQNDYRKKSNEKDPD